MEIMNKNESKRTQSLVFFWTEVKINEIFVSPLPKELRKTSVFVPV
jgi:hypothetical protein